MHSPPYRRTGTHHMHPHGHTAASKHTHTSLSNRATSTINQERSSCNCQALVIAGSAMEERDSDYYLLEGCDNEGVYNSGKPGRNSSHFGAKKLKATNLSGEGGEDRISALPDGLIVHILTLLRSTKEAVKTGVLSKRWQHLWTELLNLYFQFYDNPDQSLHRTLALHSTPKINKFLLDLNLSLNPDRRKEMYDRVDTWIGWAARKGVQELNVFFTTGGSHSAPYSLPQICCSNDSLRELKTRFCNYEDVGNVDWRSLKILDIECSSLSDEIVQNILSGSPVLEYLRLCECHGINRLNVASRSLKTLVIDGVWCLFEPSVLEISAPYLENLGILGSWYLKKCKLINLSSLVTASLSFQALDILAADDNFDTECGMVKELLEKVQHAKELKIGTWCIQVLSVLENKGLALPSLDCKSLILDIHYFHSRDLPGIANLLHSSPRLEKLVMDLSSWGKDTELDLIENLYFTKSYPHFGENYWTSQEWTFHCLSSHLKRVEIFGLEENYDNCELVFPFLEFLLKSARFLENMVVHGAHFGNSLSGAGDKQEVIKKLLSFSASSPQAVLLFPKQMSKTIV